MKQKIKHVEPSSEGKANRPSKAYYYTSEEGLMLIEGWAKRGLSQNQIAHNCGVGSATMCEWKKKYPRIAEALRKGKELPDMIVENALYERAIGRQYTEEVLDTKGNVHVLTKYLPPSVGAQVFYLKNRLPNLWKDKNFTEITGAGMPVVIKDDLAPDEDANKDKPQA